MRSSKSMRVCRPCLRWRASPPATASMTNPNPYARTRCSARISRCAMLPLSPCRLLWRVSSPSNVRRAVRNAPHPTPGWTRRWTMPRCGMGGHPRGMSGCVVPCPRQLPRVYYTPSATAHLDYCVPQRTSGGHAGASGFPWTPSVAQSAIVRSTRQSDGTWHDPQQSGP